MDKQKYIETVYTEDAPEPGDYSQAKKVFVGNGWLVYTAAFGPDFTAREKIEGLSMYSENEKEAGFVGPDDIKKQTRKALSNLEAVIKAAGGELAQVVRVNVALEKGYFEGFTNAYREYLAEKGLTKGLPARAPDPGIEFPWKGCLVLIDASAFIPNYRMEKTLKKLEQIEGKKQSTVD